MPVVGLLIVDDHRILAQSLANTLYAENGLEVLGVAHDKDTALSLAQAQQPDVVTLDLILGNHSGIAIAEEMQNLAPNVRIILLSSYINPTFVRDAVTLNLAGYLTKEEPKEDLIRAIRDVAAGGTAFCPAAQRIADIFSDDHAASTNTDTGPELSPREREVFTLRSAGSSIAATAKELGLKPATVRTLWDRALYKLGVTSGPTVGYVVADNLSNKYKTSTAPNKARPRRATP